jgi:hypothetical protein
MPTNIDQVRQRVDGLAEKLAALNIDAQDIPEILEQAMDVVAACVDAAADKRLTMREAGKIMREAGELVDTVRTARAE